MTLIFLKIIHLKLVGYLTFLVMRENVPDRRQFVANNALKSYSFLIML